jgi:hypothetical protein
MKECVPIKNRLDEFNRVILDLQNIELKVEDKNQTLNLLCLLPSSYKCFIDNLLYGQDSLSSEDVKAFSKSRKLKKQVLESHNNDHTKSLVLSGRTNNKGSVLEAGLYQIQNLQKLSVWDVIKYDTFKKIVMSRKIWEEKKRDMMLQMFLVKGEFLMMVKMF